MSNHSHEKCAEVLKQVFEKCPTVSFANSIEIEFQKLSVGIWHDRGLYSVTIADDTNTYLSSAIASFLGIEIFDAKESPNMLISNLEFTKEEASRIRKLLKEKDFAKRYEKETGYQPISSRPGA